MGIGIKELMLILIIVMMVFGTKKLRGLGADVGGWIRDFKKALRDGSEPDASVETAEAKRVIDGEVTPVNEKKPV